MAGLLGAALRGLGRAVKKSPGTSGKLRSKNMQDFLKFSRIPTLIFLPSFPQHRPAESKQQLLKGLLH
jgi:hypothetical protein